MVHLELFKTNAHLFLRLHFWVNREGMQWICYETPGW